MFRGVPDIDLKSVIVHHGLHEDKEVEDEMNEQEMNEQEVWRTLGDITSSTPL